MFIGSNLVLQWVPESGKVVPGDTKMSLGRVSPDVLQRGVYWCQNSCFLWFLLKNSLKKFYGRH